MDLLCITDASKKFYVSSKTLRYYENVGILKSIRKEDNKYRYYDDEAIERIKQILILRKMQISIKDIVRIYENEDMSTVVEVFVERINEIDDQVGALFELKSIINEFLQTMLKNGITKISALPLLYEEMDKQLTVLEDRKPITYEDLSAVSEKLRREIDISIVDLPPMRMLSSKRKDNGKSDIEKFSDWIVLNDFPRNLPGSHESFEYQDAENDTVILCKIIDTYENDSPFSDVQFNGGLFAVSSVYVDEDIEAFHRSMIQSFNENPYYKVDYKHNGSLRHESLMESVLSPDEKREKVNIFLAVKKRLPDALLYDPIEKIENIFFEEIETANPILWTKEFPIDGEREHIHWTHHNIATGITVQYPFRVDIDFRIGTEFLPQYSGAGRGIPGILFKFGNETYGINMRNEADLNLSEEAIRFNQPIIKSIYNYRRLGKINIPEINHLTWIIGEKHFAVIINNEVRFCGVNFPYMKMNLSSQKTQEIMVDNTQGIHKVYFRKITVSQLKVPIKSNLKKEKLKMITRQDNNILTDIRGILHGERGENYPFDDCMAFLMERLGEYPDIQYWYWIFAGITGDGLTQIYNRKSGPYVDCASQYLFDSEYIKCIFDAVGYEQTYVTAEQLNSNKQMYIQTLMAYIDKGIPVIFKEGLMQFVYVGYEDNGKTLLFIKDSEPKIKKCDSSNYLDQDWIFSGEKKQDISLDDIYKNAVLKIPYWLTLPEKDGLFFGAAAFRAWADDIENGRYENESNLWNNYSNYVCNLASNASNGGGAPLIVEKFAEANPQYKEMRDQIEIQFVKLSNQKDEYIWKAIENLGGGFNVTHDVMRDKEKCAKIANKLREAADISDEIVRIIKEYLPEVQ